MKFEREELHHEISFQDVFTHPSDYCTLYTDKTNVTVGACEIKGRRQHQEDAMEFSTEVARKFAGLSEAVMERALYATFEDMQKNLGDKKYQGSTACVTSAWIDSDNSVRIWNANLGDSTAYMITYDETTKETSIQLINELHTPNEKINLEEYKRVKTFKEPYIRVADLWVIGERFGGFNLPLTRALGDTSMESAGLSHIPELTKDVFHADSKKKYFILTACDGLTDRKALTEDVICAIFRSYQTQPLHHIAAALVAEALTLGSADNISAQLVEITKNPVSVAIFDGHGGNDISNALAKHFYPAFNKHIEIEQALAPKHSLVDALENALSKKDWDMVVYILMTQSDCKNLSGNMLSKINNHRSGITDAFIAYIKNEKLAEQIKHNLVTDVLEQRNALGEILNTPKYSLLFLFTQRRHNNQRITGSIHKIRTELEDSVSFKCDIELLGPSALTT